MRALRPNTDLVKVAPYPLSAQTGTGNWGADTDTFREYITLGHHYRLQCSGMLSRIKVGGPTSTVGQSFALRVWRRISTSRYLLVGTTGDLMAQITAGQVNTIDLASAITVEEGDFLGYRIDGTGTTPWHALTGQSSVATNYQASAAADINNWSAATAVSGTVLPVEAHMRAPRLAVVGDSLAAGHPSHYSYIEATDTDNPAAAIGATLGVTLGPVVNLGIGSQTSAQVEARFSADGVVVKPRFAVILVGVNDLAATAVGAIIANFTSILSLAVAAGIRPVVILILPYTNGSTATLQKRDDVNAQLTTLVNATTGAVLVDAGSAVGKNRVGGDPGNLWDINDPYSQGDGVHLNAFGYYTVAQSVLTAIGGAS